MDTLFKVLNSKDTYLYVDDDSGACLDVDDHIMLHDKVYKVHSRTFDITNSKWTIVLERCKIRRINNG